MSELWTSLIQFLGNILRFFHEFAEPLSGAYSWGVAIILLTVAVRVVLLPLAVKQINSMRAMQTLQPEIKKIQKKYKTDRGQMKTDPEKFRAQRQKQQEEMMALYKEHNVNPASGCLPLLAQAPIFFALFSLLRSETVIPELETAGFFLVDQLSAAANLPAARPGSILLLVLMAVTTYVSQKQTMSRTTSVEVQPQQKILLYVMPLMLPVFGWNLPVGVLLYWVTTNIWTMIQQWFMFRNVEGAPPTTAAAEGPRRTRPDAPSGTKPDAPSGTKKDAARNGKTEKKRPEPPSRDRAAGDKPLEGGGGNGRARGPRQRGGRDSKAKGARGRGDQEGRP